MTRFQDLPEDAREFIQDIANRITQRNYPSQNCVEIPADFDVPGWKTFALDPRPQTQAQRKEMNPSERIETALQKLRASGHQIGTAAIREDGFVTIPIDGAYRTYEEIYKLADNTAKRTS